MWYLTKLSMKSRAITIFLAALLAGGAIWATFQLKLELIPNIELPYTMVVTAYPDASPDEVNSDVTVPIENVIWEKWGGAELNHLYSTSADGVSVVFAEFEYGTDMDEVNDTIRQSVGPDELNLPQAVRNLPDDIDMEENPQVAALDFSMMPLVIFSLRGDVSSEELGNIAETQIVTELKKVEGVNDVQTEGGEKEQVLITLDPGSMNSEGISISQVFQSVASVVEYDSLGDLRNASIGLNGVELENITSNIAIGTAPRTRISRTDGVNSVGIAVFKHPDANTVEVANAAVERAEELVRDIGNGLVLSPVFDQSDFIEESINELTRMALIGAALAIIIVFIFLAAFRASLVTAMSIPFSIIIGFLAMYFTDITINMLTLSAMAIAVGRLIDNSIVIAEVVYRRMKKGEDFMAASINGSKEVAGPITASTLATVAIFIPLMFVGGIVGELFIPFALTITFALIASLLVALMVVPAFSKWFIGGRDKDTKVRAGDTWYQKLYMPSLKWALGHRILTLVIAGVLFFGSGALLPIIGTSFLPSMSQKMVVVEIELPSGTEIGATSQVAGQIEAALEQRKVAGAVESYHTTVGTSTTSVHAAMSVAMGGGDNTAEITVLLYDNADEAREQDDLELLADEITADLKLAYEIEDEDVKFITILSGDEAMGGQMGFGSGLDVSVSGESPEDVATATDMLFQRLKELDDISNLETDLSKVVPALVIDLDSDKIAARGLVEQQVQQEKMMLLMGGSLEGVSVDLDGDRYSVFVNGVIGELGFKEDFAQALVMANQLRVGGAQSVPLQEIGTVDLLVRPTHIGHIDLNLAASITGEITAKDVGAFNRLVEDEMDAVEAEIAALGIEGVEIKAFGVMEEMAESFSKMGFAIIVAIVIAYVILVVSMRSILNPLIIMVSLPLASIGALLGLLITGNTLGMSGMMGILMLVGIVLTNAIVLIAVVEQIRKEGVGTYEALVEGGRIRLRPILMTALTTMFAMLPLAFGVGGSGTLIAGELAVVVIGGLFSSTLLTLLVIPVIYSLVDGLRQRVKKRAS